VIPEESRTGWPSAVLDLGQLDYQATWERQKALVAAREADERVDTLVFVEHPAVITRGRRSRDESNLVATGEIPVIAVERGGDVTYHGPGQLVVYPIFALREGERDAPGFIRRLEAWLIAALAELGVTAERRAGYAGVWTPVDANGGQRKLASIGIAVTAKWVTWHGVAVNVTTDLAAFRAINPCGLDASVMTSIAAERDRPVTLAAVKAALLGHLDLLGRS
jgi:lipoyl(octanoyl) transferase